MSLSCLLIWKFLLEFSSSHNILAFTFSQKTVPCTSNFHSQGLYIPTTLSASTYGPSLPGVYTKLNDESGQRINHQYITLSSKISPIVFPGCPSSNKAFLPTFQWFFNPQTNLADTKLACHFKIFVATINVTKHIFSKWLSKGMKFIDPLCVILTRETMTFA